MRHFTTRAVGMVLALPLVAYEIVRGGWKRTGRRP